MLVEELMDLQVLASARSYLGWRCHIYRSLVSLEHIELASTVHPAASDVSCQRKGRSGDDHCEYVQEVDDKRNFPKALTECRILLSGVPRNITR